MEENRIDIYQDSKFLYEAFPALREHYRKHPLDWYVERWGGDPQNIKWSLYSCYNDYEWDGSEDPLLQIWDELAKDGWVGTHAGTGLSKTWLIAKLAYWKLDLWPQSQVIGVGVSERALKINVWKEIANEFPKFKLLWPKAVKQDSMVILPDPDLKESWYFRTMTAAKKQDDKTAGNFQGIHAEHMLFLVDETPKIDPSIMASIYETCGDPENNQIAAFGNPDYEGDTLHAFLSKPMVKRVHISAIDYPNVRCRKKVIGGGATTYKSVLSRIQEKGVDSFEVQTRVFGRYPTTGSNILVKPEYLDAVWMQEPKDKMTGVYGGLDTANSESKDLAALTIMRGATVTDIIDWSCPNVNAIATNLLYDGEDLYAALGKYPDKAKLDYNLPTLEQLGLIAAHLAVDAVGLGVGCINEFAKEGQQAYPFKGSESASSQEALEKYRELFTWPDDGVVDYSLIGSPVGAKRPVVEYSNVISLAVDVFLSDLTTGRIALHVPKETMDQLKKEFTSYRWSEGAGRRTLLSKKLRKKLLHGDSPNLADSLVMCNFIRNLGKYNKLDSSAIWGLDIVGI